MTPCPTCAATPCECWTRAIFRPKAVAELPLMEHRGEGDDIEQRWLIIDNNNGTRAYEWRPAAKGTAS